MIVVVEVLLRNFGVTVVAVVSVRTWVFVPATAVALTAKPPPTLAVVVETVVTTVTVTMLAMGALVEINEVATLRRELAALKREAMMSVAVLVSVLVAIKADALPRALVASLKTELTGTTVATI